MCAPCVSYLNATCALHMCLMCVPSCVSIVCTYQVCASHVHIIREFFKTKRGLFEETNSGLLFLVHVHSCSVGFQGCSSFVGQLLDSAVPAGARNRAHYWCLCAHYCAHYRCLCAHYGAHYGHQICPKIVFQSQNHVKNIVFFSKTKNSGHTPCD